LVAKNEGTVKIVDGSTCEIIGIGTVKVTERDGMLRTQEAVRYVLEACYNLISIRCLTKKDVDPSATRRRHSQPRRQGNPERREVWRVIQAD